VKKSECTKPRKKPKAAGTLPNSIREQSTSPKKFLEEFISIFPLLAFLKTQEIEICMIITTYSRCLLSDDYFLHSDGKITKIPFSPNWGRKK